MVVLLTVQIAIFKNYHNSMRASFIIAVMLLSFASSGTATQLTFRDGVNGYTSTLDTTLRSDQPDTVFGNETLIFGGRAGPGPSNRIFDGLIRFDDIFGSDVGMILPGTAIQSAMLQLEPNSFWNPPGTASLYDMLVDWDESSTWNSLNNGVTIGVETSPFATDSAINNASPIIFDVTSSLRHWSENPPINLGWLLFVEPFADQFVSSEKGFVPFRPMLSVTTVPEPSTLTLLGIGVAVLGFRGKLKSNR